MKINPSIKIFIIYLAISKEAAKIIESIEITEYNYDLAWNLLNDRFLKN